MPCGYYRVCRTHRLGYRVAPIPNCAIKNDGGALPCGHRACHARKLAQRRQRLGPLGPLARGRSCHTPFSGLPYRRFQALRKLQHAAGAACANSTPVRKRLKRDYARETCTVAPVAAGACGPQCGRSCHRIQAYWHPQVLHKPKKCACATCTCFLTYSHSRAHCLGSACTAAPAAAGRLGPWACSCPCRIKHRRKARRYAMNARQNTVWRE